jgi:hypothetical protein
MHLSSNYQSQQKRYDAIQATQGYSARAKQVIKDDPFGAVLAGTAGVWLLSGLPGVTKAVGSRLSRLI